RYLRMRRVVCPHHQARDHAGADDREMRVLPPVGPNRSTRLHLPLAFDSQSIALMSSVCCDAWWELKSSNRYPSAEAEQAARNLMAIGVMEAVGGGERDPAVLRKIAIEQGAMPHVPLDGSRTVARRKVHA